MRSIGTLSDQALAEKLSFFLRKQGIANTCETTFDKEKNQVACRIWVHEEDDIEQAEQFFADFCQNPDNAKFSISLKEALREEKKFSAVESPSGPGIEIEEEKIPSFYLTYFFIGICALVFSIVAMQAYSYAKKEPLAARFLLTPAEDALLYDSPVLLKNFNKVLESYSQHSEETSEKAVKELEAKLKELNNLPYFRGFYQWILEKAAGGKRISGPLFVKIREGEIWRLFTPCVLHKDFLHILFNMMWLWVLGKQIEMRLPKLRMLLLFLVVGILSNTAQYLMSGAYFLGFSGVVMGMAGFIWMRQKIAPWEGYPLQRSTILFLAIFIAALTLLQMISFIVQLCSWGTFSLNIANTAHITGALIGAFLGRLSFFSWRALER